MRPPGDLRADMNERDKLTATWLNGLSIAFVAAGAIAPAVAEFYGVSGPSGAPLRIGVVTFAAIGVCIHLLARFVMGRPE